MLSFGKEFKFQSKVNIDRKYTQKKVKFSVHDKITCSNTFRIPLV